MSRIYRQLFLILLVACGSLHAQESPRIDFLAKSFLRQTGLPGLSIAISKNGHQVYAKGFGYSNVEDNLPMLPSTRIRTASVAKVLTATALGRLATEGLLNFDEPIKNYVPYINSMYADLTVRQLAGHTSGLKHRPSGKAYQNKQYNTIRETLAIIDEPLLFEPGTDYRYSTNAFNLLAAVIEGASGLAYDEYMKTWIFEPLKIEHTAPENIMELTKDDAEIYYFKNGRLKRDRLNNGSYKVPGAAFRSTPSDLVRLMGAYSEEGFISKEVVQEMFRSNRLINGKETNVGIAWRSSVDAFGNKVVEHAGSWRGARTVLVHYPEEQLSISLMINAQCGIFIEETAHVFAQLFRNNSKTHLIGDLNGKVSVVQYTKEGPEKYEGHIDLHSGHGQIMMEVDHNKKFHDIHSLYNGNDFAMSTSKGLLYLKLITEPRLSGKVYVYTTRKNTNPSKEKPILEFTGLK